MANELERMTDCKERVANPEMEEPKVRIEPLKVQSPNPEALSRGGKDKCGKKKPDHKGFGEEFIFIIFLVLILLLLGQKY